MILSHSVSDNSQPSLNKSTQHETYDLFNLSYFIQGTEFKCQNSKDIMKWQIDMTDLFM